MDLTCLQTIDCKQGRIRNQGGEYSLVTLKNQQSRRVDGSYCLTCGADKKIKLWNPTRKLLLKTYGGHGDEVSDAAGSCDSSQIVSVSADKSVIVWDVSTGQPMRRLRGHAGPVTCVKYNEESTAAVTGSVDNTVMCWDLKSRSNDPIQILKDARDCITSIQVTNHEILSSSVDGHIRIYDLRVGKMTSDYIGEMITCVCFTRDGQCYITSCSDSTTRLFDKDSGNMLSIYSGYETKDFNIEVTVNHKDSHIISGSATGSIYCWDLISGSVAQELTHTPYQVVNSLSSHPTQNFLVSAAGDSIKLWGTKEEDE